MARVLRAIVGGLMVTSSHAFRAGGRRWRLRKSGMSLTVDCIMCKSNRGLMLDLLDVPRVGLTVALTVGIKYR